MPFGYAISDVSFDLSRVVNNGNATFVRKLANGLVATVSVLAMEVLLVGIWLGLLSG